MSDIAKSTRRIQKGTKKTDKKKQKRVTIKKNTKSKNTTSIISYSYLIENGNITELTQNGLELGSDMQLSSELSSENSQGSAVSMEVDRQIGGTCYLYSGVRVFVKFMSKYLHVTTLTSQLEQIFNRLHREENIEPTELDKYYDGQLDRKTLFGDSLLNTSLKDKDKLYLHMYFLEYFLAKQQHGGLLIQVLKELYYGTIGRDIFADETTIKKAFIEYNPRPDSDQIEYIQRLINSFKRELGDSPIGWTETQLLANLQNQDDLTALKKKIKKFLRKRYYIGLSLMVPKYVHAMVIVGFINRTTLVVKNSHGCSWNLVADEFPQESGFVYINIDDFKKRPTGSLTFYFFGLAADI